MRKKKAHDYMRYGRFYYYYYYNNILFLEGGYLQRDRNVS